MYVTVQFAFDIAVQILKYFLYNITAYSSTVSTFALSAVLFLPIVRSINTKVA